MIIMILITAEILCIIPFVIILFKADRSKIDEDTAITVNVGFVIGASIINWFVYAAYCTGFIISPTAGFFGGDLNVVGLLFAITPPVLTVVISYLLFLLIDRIQFARFVAREKREKISGKEKNK